MLSKLAAMSAPERPRGLWGVMSDPDVRRDALWWTAAAVTVPIAGAAIWWVSENTINWLAPREVTQLPCPSCMLMKAFLLDDAILHMTQ